MRRISVPAQRASGRFAQLRAYGGGVHGELAVVRVRVHDRVVIVVLDGHDHGCRVRGSSCLDRRGRMVGGVFTADAPGGTL